MLIAAGYNHILYKPIISSGEDEADFILIPLKPEDPRINYEETNMLVEHINSNDVIDMAKGDPFINFYIGIPADEKDELLKN